MTPVLGIVFSRDRAMQLEATLRSFHLHCQDAAQITLYVIYKTTNLRHAHQYAQLEQEYAAYGYVHFIQETDFRQHVLHLVMTQRASGAVGYVLFLVDDNLFVSDFHLSEACQALAQHPKAVGFSLRLGENITKNYVFAKAQILPPLTRIGEKLRLFDWTTAKGDFNYPLEVSSSIFRINELASLLQEFSFANPNTLEAGMDTNRLRFKHQSPHLLCYAQSVAFCNPVNKVQTVFGNRAGARPEYAAAHLAEMFDQGYRIQVDDYAGFVPHSVQQEVELVFARRQDQAANQRLKAYPLYDQAVPIAPPSAECPWVAEGSALAADSALQRAGRIGLALLCPYAVEVTWNGGPSPEDINIRLEAPTGDAPAFVQSTLGGGVLTFYPGYQFQTEAEYLLWVRGPINAPKAGLVPLESLVDAALHPCTVAVHWQFTRPHQTIRFAAGEPFATLLPYAQSVQANMSLEVVPHDAAGDLDAYEQAFQQMIDSASVQSVFQRLGATPVESSDQAHALVLADNGPGATARTGKPYKIGLLTIATGKYQQFVTPLYESVDRFFFKSHQVQKFLFTDQRERCVDAAHTVVCPIPHLPWPLITLLRYHFFLQYSRFLRTVDYLFYCDADMRLVAECGEEMLPDTLTGLVGIQHPGFYASDRSQYTYETKPCSTAYVGPAEGNVYYMGAVQGGTSDAFLRMAEQLTNNINRDLSKNHIAVWYDESHLNRYFIDHPPKLLNPSYCYPEKWQLPFPKVILALDKNHSEIRS